MFIPAITLSLTEMTLLNMISIGEVELKSSEKRKVWVKIRNLYLNLYL